MILERFQRFARHRGWLHALPAAGECVDLPPLPGASPAALTAVLHRATEVPVVLVADTPAGAEELRDDLDALMGDGTALYFPQRETLPFEDSDPHVEISGQRTEALAGLLSGRCRLLATTARALSERSPVPATGESLFLELEKGQELEREDLTGRLDAMGFQRVHTVSELGEYAVRGGIVDVFSIDADRPLRIELWGSEVASLRRFDLLDQRSVERVGSAEVLPVELRSDAAGSTDRRALLELLPESALLVEVDADSGTDRRQKLWEETRSAREARGPGSAGESGHPGSAGETARPGSAGETVRPGSAGETGHLEAEELVLPAEEAEERMARARRLRIGGAPADPELRSPPEIERDMERLVSVIREADAEDVRVVLLCDNEGQLDRLHEILRELGGESLAHRAHLALGSLSGGFRLGGHEPLLVLTDHQVFQRSRRLRGGPRFQGTATLESVASLQPGDYVVHMDHGIGRYRGLERVDVGGEAIETLKLEYADGEVLRVPHYRVDLVERYTSVDGDGDGGGRTPRVHKLGGKRWKNLKKKTVRSIETMAAELLQLYAHRRVADGHAFDGDSRWQKEMESAFLYEETPDQLEAWQDVKEDMESPRPMDRLICGDVGFGKTEVAMRAAFKAVQESKQVAVLAPTTVLVEQHLHTFGERLADFPVRIRALSRFLTPKEQEEVVEGVASGQVDIVIGTHRLLSDDIVFHDLGLVVVDEEQRFGVRQKERLKELKKAVDVLTITATPIPRTLHFSLTGLRDLSLIETAPRERLPIITHVLRWSDPILRDAIRRELDRGGQVFVVHDRVQSIEALAEKVRKLAPEAEIAVAHGQMSERKLERVMHRLMGEEVDVLVSTSIIENGLDVPNANTMIVHRADRFGLAQLYQLRGRVGRSHRRAYCYLLVPPNVNPEAEDRLKVLEHHTELGSGYEIALKDLRLRGAGNLLGEEQSGFAQAVGFDTYQRLLEKTVRGLKEGEPEPADAGGVQVSVEGDAYLPDDYILDSETKLHLYRRLSRVHDPEEVEELGEELRDRFGPLPEAAQNLLASVRLERLGAALEAEWIRVSREQARINFRPDAVPPMKRLRNALQDRQLDVEVRRVQPLSLVMHRAGPEPLLPTLVEALELLGPGVRGRSTGGGGDGAVSSGGDPTNGAAAGAGATVGARPTT